MCSAGDPVATGCGCQGGAILRNLCMLSSWTKPEVCREKRCIYMYEPELRPIEGVGGKRWAKMLHYICFS